MKKNIIFNYMNKGKIIIATIPLKHLVLHF